MINAIPCHTCGSECSFANDKEPCWGQVTSGNQYVHSCDGHAETNDYLTGAPQARRYIPMSEQAKRSAVVEAIAEILKRPEGEWRKAGDIYRVYIEPLVRERDDATAAREANGRRLLVAGKRIAELERQVGALRKLVDDGPPVYRDYTGTDDTTCAYCGSTVGYHGPGHTERCVWAAALAALEPSTAQEET